MRKILFQNGEYYHIFNRGVDRRDIFCDDNDYIRFIRSMREFNIAKPIGSLYEKDYCKKNIKAQGIEFPIGNSIPSGRLVKIIAYCLNGNHYHLLVEQSRENGIVKFFQKLGIGYTNYFNLKYNRKGSLFEGKFKAIQIKFEGQFIQLSAYINTNPEIHKFHKAEKWPWSSYQDYLNIRNGTLCDKNVILKHFNRLGEYSKLTNYIIKESQDLKSELKECMLE